MFDCFFEKVSKKQVEHVVEVALIEEKTVVEGTKG